MTEPVEVFRIDRMSEDAIIDLARDVVMEKVFIANKPETIRECWGLLWLGWMADEDRSWLKDFGAVYEYRANAQPFVMNGKPTFFSAQFVHKEDMVPLLAHVERLLDALGLPRPEVEVPEHANPT